jgi:NTP pyrophosphatase (non-canonical NTP hydrolase)
MAAIDGRTVAEIKEEVGKLMWWVDIFDISHGEDYIRVVTRQRGLSNTEIAVMRTIAGERGFHVIFHVVPFGDEFIKVVWKFSRHKLGILSV